MRSLAKRPFLAIGLLAIVLAMGYRFVKLRHVHLEWTSDYKAALKEAKRTNRLVFVNFDDDESPVCQKFRDQVLSTADFAARTKGFILVQIEDEDAQDFGVEDFPEFRILTPEGKVLSKIVGIDEAAMNRAIDDAQRKVSVAAKPGPP